MTSSNAPTLTNHPASDLCLAYQQAHARYLADPQNPHTIRALGWVYAQLLKDASGSTDTSRMSKGLALIADFPMGEDNRWRESIGWSICRFLLRHSPDTLSLNVLAQVVSIAESFIPAEPGLLRSVWWKALLRHDAAGPDWRGQFVLCDWEVAFRTEDEQSEAYGEGKTARPLVEGVLQAVLRQLLSAVILPEEIAAPWLARLAKLTSRHPDWVFLPYYHAQLLQRLDRKVEAMQVFLPFARLKKNDFWVWSMLAELVEPAQVPACYARALTLRTPEPFLVKVRQRTAAWLIGQNRWAEARAEIDRLVQTRRDNQWPLPAEVQQWLNAPHYTQAELVPLGGWYTPLLALAENLLWADCPETVVLITGLDVTGQYVNVAIDEQTTGSFPIGKFKISPVVGGRLALRYALQEKNGRRQLRVQTATETDRALTNLQIRKLAGPLRIVGGKGFGFVNDVYVSSEVLSASSVHADELVQVDAFTCWDSVKQKRGWRAFRIAKEIVNLPV